MSRDLDDFDFDGGFEADFTATASKSRSGVVAEIKYQTKRIQGDILKNPFSYIKKFGRAILPDDYKDLLDDVASDIETNKAASKKKWEELAQGVKEAAGLRNSLSNKAFKEPVDKIYKKFFGDEKTVYTEAKQTSEQAEQADIKSTIDSIFASSKASTDVVVQTQTVLAARAQAAESTRHAETQKSLSGVGYGIAHVNQFNVEVTERFYRKTLELQLKSYYSLADLVRTNKNMYESQKAQLAGILANTSLPDISKTSIKQQLKKTAMEKASSGIFTSFGGKKTSIGALGKAINKNGDVSGISQMLSMLGMAGSMGDMFSIEDMVADAAVNYGIDKLAKPLKNRFEEYLESGDSKTLKDIVGIIKNPALAKAAMKPKIEQLRKKISTKANSSNSKPFKMFADAALTALDKADTIVDQITDVEDGRVRVARDFGSGMGDLKEASSFDVSSRLSLVEVIPGFLSRIHYELLLQRDPNAKMMDFDFTKGKFVTADSKKIAALKKITQLTTDDTEYMAGSLLSSMSYSKTDKGKEDEAIVKKAVAAGLKSSGGAYGGSVASEPAINYLKSIGRTDLVVKLTKYDKELNDPKGKHSAASIHKMYLRNQTDVIEQNNARKALEASEYLSDLATVNPTLYNDLVSSGVVPEDGESVNLQTLTDKARKALGPEEQRLKNGSSFLRGPGTSTSDSIRTKLSVGEAVLPAGTVAAVGSDNISELIKRTTGRYPDNELNDGGKYARGVVPKSGNYLSLIASNTEKTATALERMLEKNQTPVSNIFGDKNEDGVSQQTKLLQTLVDSMEKLSAGVNGLNIGLGDKLSHIKLIMQNTYATSLRGAKGAGEFIAKYAKKGGSIAGEGYDYGKAKMSDWWKYLRSDPVRAAMKEKWESAKSFVTGSIDNFKNSFNTAKTKFTNMSEKFLFAATDVYVIGESIPRLLKLGIERGDMYFDKDSGNPIKSLKDLRGSVIDKDGNTILTIEELNKGVVDNNGKPIVRDFSGLKDKIRALMMRKGIIIKDTIMKMASIAKQKGADFLEYITDKFPGVGKFFSSVTSNINLPVFTLGTNIAKETHNRLVEIRDLLNKKLNRDKTSYEVGAMSIDTDKNAIVTQGATALLTSKEKPSTTEKKKSEANKEATKLQKQADLTGPKQSIKDKAINKLNSVKGFFTSKEENTGFNKFTKAFKNDDGSYKATQLFTLKNISEGIKKLRADKSTSAAGSKKPGVFKKLGDRFIRRGAETDKTKSGSGLLSGLLMKVLPMIASGVMGLFGLMSGGLGTGLKMALGVGKMLPGAGSVLGAAGSAAFSLAKLVGSVGLTAARVALPVAGSMLGSVAGAAGSLALRAGSMLLGGPVGWAVLAGTAAYYGYKYITRNKATDLDKLRFYQYGLGEEHKDRYNKVKNLEGLITENNILKLGNNEVVGLDDKGLSKHKDEILEMFDIDPKNSNQVKAFGDWFYKRFKPVFIKHANVYNTVVPGTRITESDKLKDKDVAMALKSLKMTDNLFKQMTSPFAGETELSAGAEQVFVLYNDLVKKYGDPNKGKKVPVSGVSDKLPAFNKTGAAAYTKPARNTTDTLEQAISKDSEAASTAFTKYGFSSDTSLINPETYARCFAYGLTDYDAVKARILIDLEMACNYYATASTNSVTVNADINSVFKMVKDRFGLSDLSSTDGVIWQTWFKTRFVPIYTMYLTRVYEDTGKLRTYKGGILMPISKAAINRYIVALKSVSSAWGLSRGPWGEYKLNTDPKSLDKFLAYFTPESITDTKTQGMVENAKPVVVPTKTDTVETLSKSMGNNPSAYINNDAGAVINTGDDGKTAEAIAKYNLAAKMGPVGSVGDPTQASRYLTIMPGVDVSNGNPDIIKLFYSMVAEYGEKTGKKIQLNSFNRSLSQQKALYSKYPNKAAPPGSSMHNFGLAFDINSADAKALNSLGLLEKYGFTRPIPNEPWHVEPAAIQGVKSQIKENPIIGAIATRGAIPPDLMSAMNAAHAEQAVTTNNVVNTNNSDQIASVSTPKQTYALPSGNTQPTAQVPAPSVNVASNDDTGDSPQTGTTTPKGDNNIHKVIDEAAQKAQMNPGLLKTVLNIESSLNPNAQSGTGAVGLGQFIPSTWNGMINKYGRKYGLGPNTARTDPRASALMTAEYLKENQRNNGTEDPVISYLSHVSPAGTKLFLNLLKNNPNAPVNAAYSSSTMNNNKELFYINGRVPTAAELYKKMSTYLANKAKVVGATLPAATLLNSTSNTSTIRQPVPTYTPDSSGGSVASTKSKSTSAPTNDGMLADVGTSRNNQPTVTTRETSIANGYVPSAKNITPQTGNVEALLMPKVDQVVLSLGQLVQIQTDMLALMSKQETKDKPKEEEIIKTPAPGASGQNNSGPTRTTMPRNPVNLKRTA